MKIDLPVILAIVNIIFALILFFLVLAITKKEQILKNKFSRSEQNSREILEKAHLAALKVMNNSDKLIDTINQTYKKASKDLFLELQRNNNEIYKNLYEKILTSNVDFYKNALVDLNLLFQKKIEENSGFFKKQFEEFDEFVKLQKIESIKEIENYKKNKIQSIEDEFSRTLKDVIIKTIPTLITQQQHEKIIYLAIEKAKKEGFFKNL